MSPGINLIIVAAIPLKKTPVCFVSCFLPVLRVDSPHTTLTKRTVNIRCMNSELASSLFFIFSHLIITYLV